LSGTVTAFLAPLVVGIVTDVFDSQRAGMASLVVLMVVGYAGLLFVREEQSQMPAPLSGTNGDHPG